jgi:hypothetical protein
LLTGSAAAALLLLLRLPDAEWFDAASSWGNDDHHAMLDEVDRMVKELAPPIGPHVPDPPLQFAGETSMFCKMSCSMICNMLSLSAHVLLAVEVDQLVKEPTCFRWLRGTEVECMVKQTAPPIWPHVPDPPLQFAGKNACW